MGYKIVFPAPDSPNVQTVPEIHEDEGTTSWRDVKKALRSWYLEQAAGLRSVSEKDYFGNNSRN